MSSRSVSVVLTAQVQNYLSNMRAAEQHTKDVERAARSATEQFRVHNEALTKVGVGMLAVGATAALGLGVAIKASTEYGAKLAQLQSLSHASQGEMAALSDAAMKQGQAFGYSATQVADAEIELTKAGRSTAQMLGGDLKGALALAAAGQMDVAEATSIGVTAITQFASSGATIPHTADLLAAGADKALGSVQDLGMALKQGGLVSAQMGLTLDDTVGTLSAFAQAGLIGSDAGTSFKTMLLSLQSPSSQAEKYLQKYNLTAYDSQGAFVGITNLAGQLHDKLGGLSQAQRDAALSTIFGSDAIRAANVLYTQGASGIGKWIHDVNDTGFASAQAAGKLNSLQGDLQKLSAAFQTDMIKSGQSADGFLRGRVQSVTTFVEALGDIPAPAQAAVVGTTAVVAGVALVGGATLMVVPKITAARTALQELGIAGGSVGKVIGAGSGILLGIGALISGFAALGEHGTASTEQVKKAAQDLEGSWAKIDERFGNAGNAANAGKGLAASLDELSNGDAANTKWFDGITGGISHLSDVYKANEATLDAMGQQLSGLAQQNYGDAAGSFGALTKAGKLTGDQTRVLLSQMGAYRNELVHLSVQAGVATDDQTLLNVAQGRGAAAARVLAVQQALAANGGAKNAAAIRVMGGAADEATSSVKDLVAAIDGLDGGELDARSAARKYQQALDDATAAIAKNGKTAIKNGTELDISTEAGRNNQEQLDGIADSTKIWAESMTKAHAPAAAVNKVLEDGKQKYADAAVKMGLTRHAANLLAEGLLGIPKVVQPKLALSGVGTALDRLAAFEAAVKALNGTSANVDVNYTPHGWKPGMPTMRAAGGAIDGPGPKGVDSVPAILAPGEHVLTAGDVDRLGGQGGAYRFRSALASGAVQAFAKGGAVHSISAKLPKKAVHLTEHGTVLALASNSVSVRSVNGIAAADERGMIAQRAADTAQRSLNAAEKALKVREAAEAAAQKAADKARDAAAAVFGKGSSAKKHAATMRARAASAALTRAKKAVTTETKRVDSLKKTRDADVEKQKAGYASAAQLRLNREDFVSAERRTPDRASTDPLSYVDELRQMSRDDNYNSAQRKTFDDAANKYESALVKLGKASEDATKKLDDLKQSSVQLHDSIKGSISGGYTLGGAAAQQTASGWVMRDGIRYQTTSSTPTAGSIAAYYHKGAGDADAFAAALQQLAGRGLDVGLLAQLAGMGTEQGMPIAQALLSASPSELGSINSDFGGIASAADRAGTTVADATYAEQIKHADENAQKITDQIATDGEALRKLLGQAFGLSGYAVGTDSATPGLHLVGEAGPELIGFRGGEKVLRAPDTARWIRGAGHGAGGGQVLTVRVEGPQSLDLVDAGGGLITTMHTVARGVAVREITADALHDAVLLAGGAA